MSEIQFKIGTFGESRVGKTCIINQYANETFNPSEESSYAPSISEKAIEINSEDVLLKLWDTAGQERYMSLTKQYFWGLDGILLVYDVTAIESFEKIQFWVDTIKGEIDIATVNINLAANKVDKKEQRKITKVQGEELAKKLGVDYFEVSAKTGQNINAIFQDLARKMYNSKKQKEKVKTVALNNKEATKKKGGCCGDSKKE